GAPREHLTPHLLGRERAAFAVDVQPVRRDRDREHLGAKLPEHGRGNLVGGAIRTIDDNPQPVEPEPFREALLDEFDIAAAGILEPLGATELARRSAAEPLAAERLLDFYLEIVGQLVAVAAEQFDAVIGI